MLVQELKFITKVGIQQNLYIGSTRTPMHIENS